MPTSLRLRVAPVAQRDLDVVGAVDHVVVGQQVALGRDDHARAEADLALFLHPLLLVTEEEAEHRVVAARMPRRRLAGGDADDRRRRALRRGAVAARRGAAPPVAGGRPERRGERGRDRPGRGGSSTARCGSHSGFSVATTNSSASATVTVCENSSQLLRIGVLEVATGSQPRWHSTVRSTGDFIGGDNRPMSSELPPPIALTLGDACGIGPEILARLFREADSAGCFVVGDVAVMRRAAALTGGMLAVATIERPADARQVPPNCIAVLPPPGLPPDLLQAPIGQVDARAGAAAAACIALCGQAGDGRRGRRGRHRADPQGGASPRPASTTRATPRCCRRWLRPAARRRRCG